ncbi:MAG: S9 family peptidase [Thermotogae bacterium]|uniref:S9 family peptidase n=1 Tax=Kosmotoga sp. TaxID=1955248 RepID=UPI000F28053E|nr:S9 family peptidase [Kosmotoga sp.]MBO8166645.1 S9 family peptidase [Kosmotoga sp.]MCD6160750.1 S9 family peptidase [Kosmotoga sp.]RKX50758.1 MAG: S9 family peptidase [Thermotogota bacterium]
MKTIKLSDIYKYVSVGDLHFLPHDNTFLFVRKTMDAKNNRYKSNIWIQGYNGRNLRQLTFGDSDFSPTVSPDGKKLFFLSKREKSKGIGLYLMPFAGGEAMKIREFSENITNLRWAGKNRLSFVSYPGCLQKKKKEDDDKRVYEIESIPFLFNGKGITEGKKRKAFVFDTKRGKVTQLAEDPSVDVVDVIFSPDGTSYVTIAKDNPEANPIMSTLYHVSEGKKTRLSPEGISIAAARWKNNSELFVIAIDSTKAFSANPFIALATLNGIFIHLTKDYDIPMFNALNSDVRGVGGRQFKVVNDSFYFLATERFKVLLKKIESDGRIDTVLDINGSIDTFDVSEKGDLIFTASTPSRPLEIFKYSNGKSRKLTSFNSWINNCIISSPEMFRVTASDGKDIDAWILKPPDFRADKKYPVILEIHGGPKTAYGNAYLHEFQMLAAEGFVVIYCNPRGSHGYNSEFADIRGHYGERDFLDIMEVIEFAVNEFTFIDSERLGVTGGSYGGFMTNWIVGHTDIFKAAVSQRSISNFVSFYGTTDIGYFFAEDQIGLSKPFWEEPETYMRQSPLTYVSNVETPLLLIHSLDDYRCSVPEAMQFFTALRRLGKTAKLILFPKENHELSRSGLPSHREKRLKALLNWFKLYLRGVKESDCETSET